MHPLVALVAANAAEQFGKELGSAVAGQIFGGGKGSAGEQAKYLKAILAQLVEVNHKLDQILGLLRQLPEVMLGAMQTFDAQKAEIALTSDRDLFIAKAIALNGGIEAPPDEVKVGLLENWKALVRWEHRTDQLLQLPALTEYLRVRLLYNLDATFRAELEAKLAKVNAEIANAEKLLDRRSREVKEILDQSYMDVPFFAKKNLVAEGSMLDIKLNTTEYAGARIPPDPRNVHRYTVIWNEKAQEARAEVKVRQQRLLTAAQRLRSLIAVKRMLETYTPHLKGAGTVQNPVGGTFRLSGPDVMVTSA